MSFCFFKRKTAYEMRISDWSSDVCSSDLGLLRSVASRCETPFGAANRGGASKAGHGVPGFRAVPAQNRAGERNGGAQIGRAWCRERVCQYGNISVVAGSLKKKLREIYQTYCKLV